MVLCWVPRENGDKLDDGVDKIIKVYIAQKRKIKKKKKKKEEIKPFTRKPPDLNYGAVACEKGVSTPSGVWKICVPHRPHDNEFLLHLGQVAGPC